MDAITSAAGRALGPDLWRQLADHMPQQAWIADSGGTPFWFNRRCLDYTGRTLDELIGSGWQDSIHPRDRERVAADWAKAIAAGRTYESVFDLRAANGDYCPFLARAEPLPGPSGEIGHWFGTLTDISAQAAAEKRARFAAERLRRAVTIANLFVWESDRRSNTTQWGENAAEILGIPYEDLPTGPGEGNFFVAEDEKPALYAAFNAATEKGLAHFDAEFRGRDGRHWRAECQLAYAPDGTIERVYGATRDISVEAAESRRKDYLLRLEEKLRATVSPVEAKRAAAHLVGEVLGASRACYAEVDSTARQVIISEEFVAPGVPSIAGVHSIPGDIFDRYLTGRALVTEDFLSDPAFASAQGVPAIASLPFRAVLDVPLLRDGQLVAILAIHDVGIRRWSNEDVALAMATAERTWDSVERARAEEQLRLSENQFRSTADALPGMLFVTDGEGGNIYINDFYRDYTGKTDKDALGRGWSAVVHPDDLPLVEGETREARASERAFVADYRLLRYDGEFRWHTTRATPIRDATGKIVRWVGVSLDIHDRRQAEEQARLTADEIAVTYATAPIGLAVFDPELRYVRINERLAEMNGIPAADHIGRTLHEMVPDISDPLGGAIGRALAGEEVWGYEVSGETAAAPGVLRTWRENWLPIRDSSGKITGAAGSIEEITAEKAAERALAQSEAQFRTLAEALPGMLFITSMEAGNLYVNETFASYTGLPKNDLLGSGWLAALHPDDLERGTSIWAEAVSKGGPYEAEYRFRRHDGEYRWHAVRAFRIELTGTPEKDQWVGTCIDIHDRITAEEELRESEAFARRISDVAPAILYLYDLAEKRNVWGNREMVETLGYSFGEIEAFGDNLMERLMHPEDLERYSGHFERLMSLADGESIEFRYRFVKPDGRYVWLLSQDMIFRRDEKGVPTQIIGAALDITQQEEALQALRTSEERYRALFESMDQGFCTIQVVFDGDQPVDYRFTELNPAFSRHTGLDSSVLGKGVLASVPGLERSWFERYGKIAWTGEAERFIDYAEPLGRWFEVYAFPVGQLEERSVAILFSDVTERKEREEALRRSEEELRLRLNAIPQMVWSTLPDGYHDFYNDRWYEFTGAPPGSTDGEEWNGMFHPEDQPIAWDRWEASLASGEPYEIEYRLRHHSGEYRWVLGRALPIRGPDGGIVRWMGTCTDIDDRVEARRALEVSEARLRAIFQAVPVGLMFADADGAITGSNDQILDFLAHEIVRSGGVQDYEQDYVAFHEDGRRVASHEYPMARALQGEDRPELECQVQRGDGSLRWLRYIAAPIRGPGGEVTGGVVASIDIDQEKRLTESLEREVERVVAEREAAQEALRQSQKLEAMGQLTGGVAHDFNNLLTPIIGSLDLLQRKQVLDGRTGRLVDGALASAEKARVLVQRLLAFARRQPLRAQAIDLGRIVGEMSELIDSTSGPRVKVEVSVPETLPPALADGNQLEMALLNLAVNARDAMPDGGTLTIAARAERASAGKRLGLGAEPHLVLSVSDTGLGMDEETRRRAIEPFFSTKGVGKGTGLGLSMVHGLAAQLGGVLDIRSALGVGTTIELWLPVARTKEATESEDVSQTDRHSSGIALLVDDEELVRASTAGMLSDLGFVVEEAASGEEAIAKVRGGLKPDILITDQLMPGLSGTDLAVRLRETLSELPVLIVSGYADLDSLSPGFPHLSKPFRQAELSAALEGVAAKQG